MLNNVISDPLLGRFTVRGWYSIGAVSGAVAGSLAANGQLFSMLWGDSAYSALITRVTVAAKCEAFSSGIGADFQAIIGRNATAAASGGTAIVPGNSTDCQALSSQDYSPSLFNSEGDLRIASTGALTAGTLTLDTTGIITDDTLFSIADGDYAPANIQIKIAYSVRDANTWEFARYTKDKQLNSAVPTQPRIIRREDIFGKAVGSFDDQFNLTGFTDNTDSDNLNQEADYYLEAAAQEYIEQDSLDVPYAGLVPIQVDGLIQQVTYTIASGPGGSTMTRASLATEHNPFVLPWPARRRNEKERHARSDKTQDGRSVLDTRSGGF